MSKISSRMFPFITCTWNPVGGVCPHNCIYCWAKGMIKRFDHKKYSGKYRIIEKEFKKKVKENDFVFVCDMLDLFADNVPTRIILRVLDFIRESSAKFLLMTKNPKRYNCLLIEKEIPSNVILGVTIETNLSLYINYKKYSNAPLPSTRIGWFQTFAKKFNIPLFVSIEPIFDFNDTIFVKNIELTKPWGVAIGYDNYNNELPEPSLEKTMKLINKLEGKGIQVFKKTIKKAWWEKT